MSDNTRRIILVFVVLAAFVAAFWYLTDIFVYIFVSIILSILGHPLMNLLLRIKIKGKGLPQSVAAAIALISVFGVIGLAAYWIIPLVIFEVQQLANIDATAVVAGMQDWFGQVDRYIGERHWLPVGINLSQLIVSQWQSFLAAVNFSSIFGNVIDIATGIFIFVFSVMFMTFFALKDNQVFLKMLKKLIPTSLRSSLDNILDATKKQLIRYFTGVFSEMAIVGFLDGLLCYLLGVPHALLIGFFAGLLNIIPYVGPLMACGVALLVGGASIIVAGLPMASVTVVAIKVVSIFIGVKLLDDFVLQPTIYGKSVSAHPLEIFLVILIAGKIGGIWGMMFAVPAYTLVRIIVHEFFSQYFTETNQE